MAIDALSPMKKPNTLDVPMASLGEVLFLIKNGTNKVAPPIPTMPEIIEKTKLITFDSNRLGKVLFFEASRCLNNL